MNLNKLLIGGLIGGVVLFFSGWIFYGMLLSGFFEANMGSATGVNRGENDMILWALILGNLAGGLLLSFIFVRWANISTVQTGAIAGATIGFLIALSFDFIMYATTNLGNLTSALVDPLVYAVMNGLAGAAIGWYLGRTAKA